MNSPCRARALAMLAAVTFSAGCGSDTPSQQDADLIGGEEAGALQFPATVKFERGCTASKVGPRQFLLAAHCVHDPYTGQLAYPYDQPGLQLSVFHKGRVDYQQSLRVRLEAVAVHPGWLRACDEAREASPDGVCFDLLRELDLAVITVEYETPEIPMAMVSTQAVEVGEPVVIMGFGCQLDEQGQQVPSNSLKFAESEVVVPLDADGSVLPESHDEYTWRQELLFASRGYFDGAASGCSGDSGGPVYRNDGEFRTVIGVNSHYLIAQDNGVTSSHSTSHARVDGEGAHGAAAWLADQGVVTR